MFDAHLHIIDPRYALVGDHGCRPEPFTAEDYRRRTASLDVVGGAVVAASFQGRDPAHLVSALRGLGSGFVAVAELPASTSDAEIVALDRAGVRGVRVNAFRGGREALRGLERIARRVHELVGWHIELYVDSRELPALAARLARVPRLVIDHLGMTGDGYGALLALIERGVKVKASGFGRVQLDVPASLSRIAELDPGALMFGTDLPSTRARRPFQAADVELIERTLGEKLARRALLENALDWYRPAQ